MKCTVAVFAIAFTISAGAQDLPVTEKLVQRAGVQFDAHIGGQIFKVTRASPLPNAFGRADIFGRTVDRGSVELRYQGVTPDGKLVFRFIDIDVRSNETTMNRTPMAVTSGSTTAYTSGRFTGSSYSGTTTDRGTAFTIRGQEGRNEALPPNVTEFAVDSEKKRDLRLGGVTVTVVEYDETSLRYTLAWNPKE